MITDNQKLSPAVLRRRRGVLIGITASVLLLTVIAVALATLPRLPALLLGAGAAVAAGWGLSESHQRSGFFAPARETIAFVSSHHRPGEVVMVVGRPGDQYGYDYYAVRKLHPTPALIDPGAAPKFALAVRSGVKIVFDRAFWKRGAKRDVAVFVHRAA